MKHKGIAIYFKLAGNTFWGIKENTNSSSYFFPFLICWWEKHAVDVIKNQNII